MKKIVLSNDELEVMVSDLVQKPFGRVSFCEDFEEDIIEWEDDAMKFDEVLPLLNKRFNIEINDFDAIEINGTETGFVFYF